jgi:hypothetical protein
MSRLRYMFFSGETGVQSYLQDSDRFILYFYPMVADLYGRRKVLARVAPASCEVD